MFKIEWSGKTYNYSKKEINYLSNVIQNSKTFTQGNQQKRFENNLRKFLKKKTVFCINSAASALELIAQLLKIKKGDEVIIPAHTYCASAIPFARNGAKIIWADINNNRVIDIEDIKKKITKKTKAIVIVHLYGFCVDVDKIRNKVDKRIKIIEDCAQAFGSMINGKMAGTMSDYGCFSFHSQKNITTLGEGGAIYVKKKSEAHRIPGLRHNGHSNFLQNRKKYWSPAMGNLTEDLKESWPFKFTLSEIQCAAGVLGLKKINQYNKIRIIRAKKLISKLSNHKELEFTKYFQKKRHVYHLLIAKCLKNKYFTRDDLITRLYEKYKIKCIVQYYPLYKYDLFKKKGFGKAKCKNTDILYDNMISFPFHIHMPNKEFDYMVYSIEKCIQDFKLDKK